MNPLLVFSTQDVASMHIYRYIDKQIPHVVVETSLLTTTHLPPAHCYIFCSKHQGKAGVPTLSVHSIGNFDEALYGGISKTLVQSPTSLLYHCFHGLLGLPGYDVVYEATHHGPYMDTPCMFIEIGSTLKEWQDSEAAQKVAHALSYALRQPVCTLPVAIGIGGLHTCSQFNKLVAAKKIQLGHVCPAHHLHCLDEAMLAQMLQPHTDVIVVDWKGLKEHKLRVVALLKDKEWKKTKQMLC